MFVAEVKKVVLRVLQGGGRLCHWIHADIQLAVGVHHHILIEYGFILFLRIVGKIQQAFYGVRQWRIKAHQREVLEPLLADGFKLRSSFEAKRNPIRRSSFRNTYSIYGEQLSQSPVYPKSMIRIDS